MTITVRGQPGTVKVIHRSYPQALRFHVKHDVAALPGLWIGRCIAQPPDAPFHVKRGFTPLLNRRCAQGVDSGLHPHLPHVPDRVVPRETFPVGGASIPGLWITHLPQTRPQGHETKPAGRAFRCGWPPGLRSPCAARPVLQGPVATPSRSQVVSARRGRLGNSRCSLPHKQSTHQHRVGSEWPKGFARSASWRPNFERYC